MLSPIQSLHHSKHAETDIKEIDFLSSIDRLNRKFADLTQEYHQFVQNHQPTNENNFSRMRPISEKRSAPDLKNLGLLADRIYKSRRKRNEMIPGDIFGEPSWDILLDLFGSECRGRQISVTSACIASAVPSTTALRWISILVDAGFVARRCDPGDRRRAYVELTPMGRALMVQYLTDYLDT